MTRMRKLREQRPLSLEARIGEQIGRALRFRRYVAFLADSRIVGSPEGHGVTRHALAMSWTAQRNRARLDGRMARLAIHRQLVRVKGVKLDLGARTRRGRQPARGH